VSGVPAKAPGDAGRFWRMSAVVFDMDGVITDTARSHAESWSAMFNEYLSARAAGSGEPVRPFTEDDYLKYVDGKPRYDGVRSFLGSRGIDLPEGTPEDDPGLETVCGLGNRKNVRFLERLHDGGADAYPSTVRLVTELRERDVPVAVITSSRNSDEVLGSAGVRHLFAVKVDGNDCDAMGLAGKPEPDIFLEAARQLGSPPGRTAVVEDAQAGVEAGRRGGFGLVVGVDRSGQAEQLAQSGADIVVSDLLELLTDTQDL
jgi:beta-phosphoglucomutase family hydrolase